MKNLNIIVVVVILSTTLSVIGQEKTIAVLPLDGHEISKGEALTLTDKLRAELFETQMYRVVERQNMVEILSEQGFQQTGCTSTECLVEAGRLLNAQKMLGGSIGKIGNSFSLFLRVVDIETATIDKSDSWSFKCSIEKLSEKKIGYAVRELLDIDSGVDFNFSPIPWMWSNILRPFPTNHWSRQGIILDAPFIGVPPRGAIRCRYKSLLVDFGDYDAYAGDFSWLDAKVGCFEAGMLQSELPRISAEGWTPYKWLDFYPWTVKYFGICQRYTTKSQGFSLEFSAGKFYSKPHKPGDEVDDYDCKATARMLDSSLYFSLTTRCRLPFRILTRVNIRYFQKSEWKLRVPHEEKTYTREYWQEPLIHLTVDLGYDFDSRDDSSGFLLISLNCIRTNNVNSFGVGVGFGMHWFDKITSPW